MFGRASVAKFRCPVPPQLVKLLTPETIQPSEQEDLPHDPQKNAMALLLAHSGRADQSFRLALINSLELTA